MGVVVSSPLGWLPLLMVALFVGMLLLAGVAVAVLVLVRGVGTLREVYERRPLLSEAEAFFYRELVAAVGGRYVVFTKVGLGDLLQVKNGVRGKEWAVARNKIQSKHVDFVLCDARTLEAVRVVELDDRSHRRGDRQARDGFVDGALRGAGIGVVRVPWARAYPGLAGVVMGDLGEVQGVKVKG